MNLFETGPRFWFTVRKRTLTDRQTDTHTMCSHLLSTTRLKNSCVPQGRS